MKKLLLFSATLAVLNLGAQVVNIPDAAFKSILVGDNSINTNGDTEIQVSEANAYSGEISVYQSNISDLTGIEYFTNITTLHCESNSISSLDVSSNTMLEILRIGENNISSIDVSNNINLEIFYCNNNMIESIDVSSCPDLVHFRCEQNTPLTYLDINNGNGGSYITMNAKYNPNLTCINVEDETYNFEDNFGYKYDSEVIFSENCAALSLEEPYQQETFQDVSFYNLLGQNIESPEEGELVLVKQISDKGVIRFKKKFFSTEK